MSARVGFIQLVWNGRLFYSKDDSNEISVEFPSFIFLFRFDSFSSFSVNAVILSSFWVGGCDRDKRIGHSASPCGGSANYTSAEQKQSSLRCSPSVFCQSWSRADLSQAALPLNKTVLFSLFWWWNFTFYSIVFLSDPFRIFLAKTDFRFILEIHFVSNI